MVVLGGIPIIELVLEEMAVFGVVVEEEGQ